MNKQSGQSILAVVMWASGISLAFISASLGLVSNQFSKVNENVLSHENRLSALEARMERLPILEDKIDKLLEKQGITFIVSTSTKSQ